MRFNWVAHYRLGLAFVAVVLFMSIGKVPGMIIIWLRRTNGKPSRSADVGTSAIDDYFGKDLSRWGNK